MSDDIVEIGQFLIDRLNEFEQEIGSGNEEREWAGHVHPAMSRFNDEIARLREDARAAGAVKVRADRLTKALQSIDFQCETALINLRQAPGVDDAVLRGFANLMNSAREAWSLPAAPSPPTEKHNAG